MPIEQVKVGQLVFARDPETGETKIKPVTDVIVTKGKSLYELVTRSKNGELTRLEVTDNHPFWVINEGWVDSIKLQPGMVLVDIENQPLQVISLTSLDFIEDTYNFTVADFNTYFAGEQRAFVHNMCACAYAGAKTTEFISGVKVVEKDTGRVLEGVVDLRPTLERIKLGGRHPHPNDGTIFRNKENRLDFQSRRDYYTEYVHPTPTFLKVGPQRIVTGKGGEIYYTPDHYDTFINLIP